MHHGSHLTLAYGYDQEKKKKKAEAHIRKVLGSTAQEAKNEIVPEQKIIHDGPVSYDEATQELYIKERGSALRNYVSAKENNNFSTKVTPVKVHVGSATVGGVTTGGIYTTGGETVFDSSVSSGYWKLEYIHKVKNLFVTKTQSYLIRRIRLTPELFEKAKASSISKYTDGKDSIIVIQGANLNAQDAKMLSEKTFSIEAQNIAKRGYPSNQKCQEILAWITGSDF